MIGITTKPEHGQQLVDKEGRAKHDLQRYLDDITILFNSDRTDMKHYKVATVPPAASAYGLIMVTDESGGPVLAFSDLTDWRRVTDRVVIS